jgi:beta-lactam-binding protein with PASTA domain
MVNLSLTGEYRDSLRDREGRELVGTEPACNTVVYSALDLIARLLSNEPDMRGILYWAVGSGDPSWDANPPLADRNSTKLVSEIYRKHLDAKQDILYDSATRQLVVNVRFAPEEAVGTLREFGLFGGNATSSPGTGYLINYRIHPDIKKTSDNSLERHLRFTFSSETMPMPLIDLIGGLLSNRSGLSGIQYYAVGSGDPSWEANPPPKNLNATKLLNETFRKRLDATTHLSHLTATHTLVVRVTLAFDQAEGVLREFGLFGGDATDAPGTGYLLNYQTHAAINKPVLEALNREFQLSLGSDVNTTVPNLRGLPMQGVMAKLREANLALGEVREDESVITEIEGLVTGQEPSARVEVPEATFVNITLSASPRINVPELRGLTLDEAADVLSSMGLLTSLDERATEESERPPGTVARQLPDAGTRVRRGTTVRVGVATPITTAVPDLQGLTAPAASIVLGRNQLTLSPPPHPVRQSATDWDTVVEQLPAAGARAPKGSSVRITLAAPHMVEVPDLFGLEPDKAASALHAAGANVLKALQLPSVPPGLSMGAQSQVERMENVGHIVRQNPAARVQVALFSTVDVSVATLPRGAIPNLIGLELEAAKAALKNMGLALGEVIRQENMSPANTVFKQAPEAGRLAATGSKVQVTVATPVLVQVPDLIGRTRELAAETLLGMRLALGAARTQPSLQPTGTVIEQKPATGESVPIGTTIQVVIAAATLPVAEAGDNLVVEFGRSFTLDASRSKPAQGKRIVKYIWTQFD